MERTCPICNEEVTNLDAICPRCGFKLVGATQSFKPVSDIDIEAPTHAASESVLRVVKGPYNGQEFVMGEGSFTIGRDPSCDLFLNNMTVSRHHATIEIDANGATIIDEGSLNGTWLNGTVIDRSPLQSGAIVQIGTFDMIYEQR